MAQHDLVRYILAVVVGFVSDWKIHQHLVRLKFPMREHVWRRTSPRADQCKLSVTLGVESHKLLVAMYTLTAIFVVSLIVYL